MDDPALDAAAHLAALRGLRRINRASKAGATLFGRLRAMVEGPARVLDLASGGGDVTVDLARRARRSGLPLEIEGCDVSPRAVEFASRRGGVRFFVHDVKDGLPKGYDIYVSSLFLHHLPEADAVTLLRRMGRAKALLVLDLARGVPGLLLAAVVPRVLTRSRVVRGDAVRSARNAFTVREARALAASAGLNGATVTPRWPSRFLLEWRRP